MKILTPPERILVDKLRRFSDVDGIAEKQKDYWKYMVKEAKETLGGLKTEAKTKVEVPIRGYISFAATMIIGILIYLSQEKIMLDTVKSYEYHDESIRKIAYKELIKLPVQEVDTFEQKVFFLFIAEANEKP